MINKKNIAKAMVATTVLASVAPVFADSQDGVKRIEISSGEGERIAKVEQELLKAKQIKYTNNKWIENSQGPYYKEYVKYEKNDKGSFEDVSVYKIETEETSTKKVIRVTDKGHRVGFEGENDAIVDFDENGKDIASKLIAEIVIHKAAVNSYNVDAQLLFNNNGKLNETGLKLKHHIQTATKLGGTVTRKTVANGNKTGVELTISGAPNAYNMIVTIWGTPVANTTDSMVSALAGLDRCETAVQVSQEGWKKSNDVILVGWGGTVDGLAAAPLASTINAPILVSNKTTLGKETKAEIDRLEAKTVYVVGGEKTVPQSIINELDAMGVKVERIAGEDRMRTSFAIAKKLDTLNDVTTTYFVGGYKGEADALSIAATAAKEKQPIILIEENRIADDVKIWLKEEKLSKANIIGGTYAINENINNDVAEIVGTGTNKVIERIQGKDVAETNAKVIERFHKDADAIFIAQDENLVDALAAGPLAAKKNAALVLATNKVTIDQKQAIEKTKAYKLFRKNLENGANINYTSVISNTIYQVGHGVSRSVVKFIENMFIQK